MAERKHEDGEPYTLQQRQTQRGSQGEKDPADGDGPLTVGEVSPSETLRRQQETPMPPSQTVNPSEESQVKHPDQERQDLSPNELREQAERDAASRRPNAGEKARPKK